jgi:hypothetical protein
VPGVKLSIKGRTIERWGDIYEIQNRSELLALSEWEKKHLLRVYKPPAKPDLDIPSMHGSGFLISDDGHILTNQHNVEIWKHLQKNPDILRRFARHEGYDSMTAQVWVIFDDKAYEAQLVHVSKKFDMAVLRAPDYTKEARLKRGEKEKDIAKFPLSASNDVPPISTIHVLGFPGLGEVARTPEERAARQLRMKDHRKIVEAFSGNQLTMSNSAGAFGKIKNDSERGRIMQYLTQTSGGNSGSPAVTPDGIVRGIHTWGLLEQQVLGGEIVPEKMRINGAGLLLPMRGEIDGAVGASKVQWVANPVEK